MSGRVSFNRVLGAIEALNTGDETIADWRDSLRRIEELATHHHVNRVLMDIRGLTSTPSVMEVFEFAANLPRQLCFAVIVGENTSGTSRFLETVARNRGIRVQACISRAEAITWLESVASHTATKKGRSDNT